MHEVTAHPFTASNRVQSTVRTYDSIPDTRMILILLHLPKSTKRGRGDEGGERAVDKVERGFDKNTQDGVKTKNKKIAILLNSIKMRQHQN